MTPFKVLLSNVKTIWNGIYIDKNVSMGKNIIISWEFSIYTS